MGILAMIWEHIVLLASSVQLDPEKLGAIENEFHISIPMMSPVFGVQTMLYVEPAVRISPAWGREIGLFKICANDDVVMARVNVTHRAILYPISILMKSREVDDNRGDVN